VAAAAHGHLAVAVPAAHGHLVVAVPVAHGHLVVAVAGLGLWAEHWEHSRQLEQVVPEGLLRRAPLVRGELVRPEAALGVVLLGLVSSLPVVVAAEAADLVQR
jgi:hypothetical protein